MQVPKTYTAVYFPTCIDTMRSSVCTRLSTAFVGLSVATFTSIAQAPQDWRVALVIGNAAYQTIPTLGNSANDAKSMSFALRKLGFNVVEVINANKLEMKRALESLQNQLKDKQAVAMLYYAGHGLQLDWHNYMVPVDAKLNQASDVPGQTVDIESVVSIFKTTGTRMNILVLDACRDNPFSGKSGSKGLAQMDAPPGTYIAFATAPGNVAEDGDAATGNGLFTHFLLKELQRPAKIEDVFKRVRLQVRQTSQGRQIPWDSSSLEDDFAFNDGDKFKFSAADYQRELQEAKDREARLLREAQASAERERQLAQLREQEKLKLAEAQRISEQKARERAEVEARQRDQQLAMAAQAERIKALATQQALEQAREQEAQRIKDLELARAQAEEESRRKKLSTEEARERQFSEEKAAWDQIKNSKNPQDFYAFLLKYPNGLISQQATFALESLDKAKITMQADKNGEIQKLGEPRYRVGDQWVSERRDDYTGRVITRATTKVDRIDTDGRVYASADTGTTSIFTVNGGTIRSNTADNTYTFDPPMMFQPGGEFQVGKKWTNATRETNRYGMNQRFDEAKIVAQEEITIAAGKFKAYQVQIKGWSGQWRFDNTYWYLPDWGVALKSIRRVYPPRGAVTKESTELVSFTRGNSPTSLSGSQDKMASK